MRRLILKLSFGLGLCAVSLMGVTSWADIDDVETGMEDALSDSEAAREAARAATARKEKELQNREKAKAAAKEAANRARVKEHDARVEIGMAEKATERIREDIARLEGEKAAYETQITKLNEKIAEAKAKTEAAKSNQLAAQQLRDERKLQTAELMKQHQAVSDELRASKDAENAMVADLEKTKKDEKLAEEKLKKITADRERFQQKSKIHIEALQTQMNQSKANAAESEAKMRGVRAQLSQIETETKLAEVEAEEAKKRADDAAQLAVNVQATNQIKIAEVEKKKNEAEKQSQSPELENKEAVARVDKAAGEQLHDQLVAKAEAGQVNVELTSKDGRTIRKFSTDCSLLEKPTNRAKVLYKSKKGSRVYTVNVNDTWTKVVFKASAAYAPLSCFESRTPSTQ